MTDKKPKRPAKGRVFQCTGFPNCNKSFTRLEHLARHRRKHTGERPFTCPHCSKNFSRLDNLRQHKQTVHAYENYIKKRDSDPLVLQTSQSQSTTLPNNHQNNHSHQNNHAHNNTRSHSNGHLGLYSTPHLAHPLRPLVLPPSLGLPYGVYYPYPGHSLLPQASPASLGAPAPAFPSLALRDPPKFNPKTRPRPLSLVHAFSDDTMIPSDGERLRGLPPADPPLRTAPPAATFAQAGSLYAPPGRALPAPGSSRFAYLTPMMVSPLSPLFHQLFNQVAGKSKLAGSTLSLDAPLDSQLLLPPALPPVRLKGLWLKDVLNKDEKLSRVAINSLIEEEK